ncbi:OstA-like protein [Rhodocytophaga aerolata]|uniref:OstA-like protein n=1 Tax=Rhodocytophaga aerolata TaxID=455078 RepID=A0ABT8R088_9BACT|nr:OstA-like protein [Rhodocytophaga aerolata]MDO1445339.1 OstA-like protein [Rhodocytophaga aerolata]
MKFIYYIILVSCCLLLPAGCLFAQTDEPDMVELEQADSLLGGTPKNGQEVRRVIGHVRFRQKGAVMTCDSAYQYVATNTLEAFGNVRIVQGDTLTVTGNKAFYDGNTRVAQMRGNVVLVDKTMTLYTEELDYNMNTSLAYYYTGGRIIDGENVLVSKQGYYNTKSKLLFFKEEVNLTNPEYSLNSDTLQYHTVTKVAYFKGPTKIVGKSGDLYTTNGTYNTVSQQSTFIGRTTIDYDKYTLTGDSVYYDKLKEIGIARMNVELVAKEDSTVIEGDIGTYNGIKGISKVYGRPVMKNIAAGDTLYMTADTLVSIDDTVKKSRKLFAYNNVKIFKSDLQGKCDSLLYNFTDSTIYFYRNPVLWSSGNQLLADSIHIQMANNKISRMYLRTNSFVVSQDSIKNFNQIKGRRMTTYFTDNKVSSVFVDGNAESLYFALDEGDSVLIGMNKMLCSKMDIRFKDNKANTIKALTTPDAVFIPPHEIEEPDRRLKGFRWRIEERPLKSEVLIRNQPSPLKPVKKQTVEKPQDILGRSNPRR